MLAVCVLYIERPCSVVRGKVHDGRWEVLNTSHASPRTLYTYLPMRCHERIVITRSR